LVFNKFSKNNSKHKGKEIDTSYQDEVRLRLPHTDDMELFGVVTLMPGTEYIKVLCEDGVERAARIPGKMRQKVWIKENDVVIVKKWEYENHKGDVVWRFLPWQVQRLKREGHLTNLPV